MKYFKRFPQDAICPICDASENKSCFLLHLDGTSDGRICEAIPTHVDCINKNLDKLRYNKRVGIIYMAI